MKKFIKESILIILLVLSVFIYVGCEADKEEENTITYYHYEPQVSTVSSFIYDYNNKLGNTDYKINVVEFDDMKKMASRLSTEIMAGEGPDIITSAELEMLSSSIEKLIKQKTFANLDDIFDDDSSDDKLDLSDYNSNILNAGVYEGKRYYLPVVFEPQILLTSSVEFSKYSDDNAESKLTYDGVVTLNNNILKDRTNNRFFYDSEDYKRILLNYIDEHVDLYSQKCNFDSENFMESITSLKEFCNSNENKTDEIVPIFSVSGQYELFALYDEIAAIDNDGDKPLITNMPNQDGAPIGKIMDAIFINNNSNNKQKILKFIKYALSEKVQSDYCGANIKNYEPGTSWGTGWEYPVNNQSYDSLFNKAQAVKYIDNTTSVSESDFMYAKNYIDKIKEYKLCGLYDYYNTEVIGSTVDKFLSGEFDKNKFLKELKSRTEIYLDE